MFDFVMTSWVFGALFVSLSHPLVFLSLSLSLSMLQRLFVFFIRFICFSSQTTIEEITAKSDTQRNREWTSVCRTRSVFGYIIFFFFKHMYVFWKVKRKKRRHEQRREYIRIGHWFQCILSSCLLLLLIMIMITMIMTMHQLRFFMLIILQTFARRYLENLISPRITTTTIQMLNEKKIQFCSCFFPETIFSSA